MRLLRRLIVLTAVLLALATAAWFAGAAALRQGVRAALAAPDSTISAAGVEVIGYPASMTLMLTRPVLRDPQGLWQWTAPRADLAVAARAPTTLRATLPPEQALMLGGVAHAVRADEAGAEVTLAPQSDLRLRQARLSARGLAVADLAAVAGLTVTLTQDATQPVATLVLDGTDLTPPADLRAALPPEVTLPAVIAALAGQARLTLDRPLNRHAAEGATPRLMAVDLDDLRLDWGDLSVRGTGAVTADAQGLASGRVLLRLTGWRVLLPLLAATGAIKPEVMPTVDNALTRLQITPTDGAAPYLELPLIFRDGRTSLGPLPLGAAPRLF